MGLFDRKKRETSDAVLRAETSGGQTQDDPSEDALLLLLEDLGEEQDYVIVERLSDASGQTYAQVMRTGDGYLVERRSGSEASHEHAVTTDVRRAHEDLTSWAHGIDRPDALSWTPGVGA